MNDENEIMQVSRCVADFLCLVTDAIEDCLHRMIFSILRHSVEQVYLGYNYDKSQNRVRIPCLSSRAGEGEKGNFLFTP